MPYEAAVTHLDMKSTKKSTHVEEDVPRKR